MANTKVVKIVIFILLAVFYGSLLLHKIELPVGDDMGRHVKNGELILQGHLKVINSNVYSYTEPNHPFINHNWLSNVFFYLLHQAVGWNGLVIFKIIILLLTFGILFLTSIKKANFWLVAFFSLPTIFILGERTTLRPEIFSYLFTAVFLYLLGDPEEHPERKRIFWLIPLQVLWVNMHLFFIIGPALVAGFLLEKIILNRKNLLGNPLIKRLADLLIMLIATCFINPNGVAGAFYPLQIFNNYGIRVGENYPLLHVLRTSPSPLNISAIIFMAASITLALSFLLNLRKKPFGLPRAKPIFYFLGGIATAMGGFIMIRLTAFFSLFFLPAVSANFNRIFLSLNSSIKKLPVSSKNLGRILVTAIITLTALLIFLKTSGRLFNRYQPGIGLTAQSDGSADFFKRQGLKGPIFNDYDIGSYLIYHLYPNEKVFVDNRPEAYSTTFFKDTYLSMLTNESVWQKILERYHFNTIFLYQYDDGSGVRGFMSRRIHDPSWALVYADSYAVILLKNNQGNQEIIKKFQINPENVEKRLEYLLKSKAFDDQVAAADIFNLLGRTDLGGRTFLKVVDVWPEKGKIWMVLGEMESNKNPHLAITYLEKAISLGQKTAEAYSFLGLDYVKIGEYDKGAKALERSLKIDPDRQDAKKLLDSMQADYK